jgi:HEAT repeat protein
MVISLFLAAMLLPGKEIVKKPDFVPPATTGNASTYSAIEVTVGALPSGIGGVPEEAVLEKGRLTLRAEPLLDFFRKRTPPGPSRAAIDALVAKLTGPQADSAQQELTAIGLPVLPALRETVNGSEGAEAIRRAREIIESLENEAASALVVHAARGLVATKAADAVGVLLAYLPYAEDNASYQEIQWAISQLAMRDGKPDPALVAALKDPIAVRRGTAAQILSSIGGPEFYPVIRPLLKDPQPSVRLGVALSLVRALDSEAVPVLIDLLAELPPSLRPTAEEYLNNLAGEWAVEGPKGFDAMSGKLRRAVWEAWWKNADGKLLLEEFRLRTPSEDEREKIDTLLAQLADPKKRDDAQKELQSYGRKATSQLRRSINNGSEVAEAAQKILESIERDEPNPLPLAAPRLLALRKPEGTIETLLGYVAVAESEEISTQLTELLAVVACPGGKAGPEILKALRDPSPARRTVAMQAIVQARATEAMDEVKKLLEDTDALVRMRAAIALTSAGNKESIPTLIQTLKEVPLENAWEAEEMLSRLAAGKAPDVTLDDSKESRTKAVAAWEKWYSDAQAGLDLTKVDFTSNAGSGQLVVIEQWNRMKGGRGRVFEMDAAGKVRWELTNLDYPWDAQVLRNGNVLIIEQQNRVTERDRKGKIVWDKYFNSPFVLERLPNGHTFLGCRNALMVVDKDGKQVFNYPYTTNTILGARRFRDGSMAFISYSGEYVRLDKSGKAVKTFTLPISRFGLSGADLLPGDRVLVSASGNNRVMEYTADGKEVWSVTVTNPTPPTRLANGNTLVATNGGMVLYEIDRKGKIVKEWKGLPHNPYRAFRR